MIRVIDMNNVKYLGYEIDENDEVIKVDEVNGVIVKHKSNGTKNVIWNTVPVVAETINITTDQDGCVFENGVKIGEIRLAPNGRYLPINTFDPNKTRMFKCFLGIYDTVRESVIALLIGYLLSADPEEFYEFCKEEGIPIPVDDCGNNNGFFFAKGNGFVKLFNNYKRATSLNFNIKLKIDDDGDVFENGVLLGKINTEKWGFVRYCPVKVGDENPSVSIFNIWNNPRKNCCMSDNYTERDAAIVLMYGKPIPRFHCFHY